MNLAWGGIVILVLLLPGFLFFVGLYFPEKFTRQLAERSALGQLAGSVLIAFLVHGTFFAINQSTCSAHCISVTQVLTIVTISQPMAPEFAAVGAAIGTNAWAILGYNLLTSAVGLVLGALIGFLVVRGQLRFLAQHTWLYNLIVEDPLLTSRVASSLVRRYPRLQRVSPLARLARDGEREVTAAYILTNVAHEGRVVLYRGYLKAFGINNDGTFTYVVLVQAVRLYLELKNPLPITTPRVDWKVISTSQAATAHLYVDGRHMANAMFDVERLPAPVSTKEFQAIVKQQESTLGPEAVGDAAV